MQLTRKEKSRILIDRYNANSFDDYWKNSISYEEYERRCNDYDKFVQALDVEFLDYEFSDRIG